MLWIGLHLPSLSLESFAATLADDEARRPVALIDEHRISAANAAAAQRGIKPGMKRATALALAPDLVLGQADTGRDADALLALAQATLMFTPMVAPEGQQAVVLEVQSCLRVFGGLEALLRKLHATLQPLGHACRIACAPTALGAALLAQWRDGLHQGAHVRRIDALRALLDAAPVWLLGPGREHWQALQGMGLATLSDLRQLPRTGLARRFGEGLLADLDRALGQRPDPREPITLPPVFDSRLELFARVDSSEQLLAAAGVLLARLVAWAQAQHARISRFTLVMQHESRQRAGADNPAQTPLEIALAQASGDAAHLRTLLRERLAQLGLPAPTLELRLQCRDLVRAAPPNGELFPTRGSEHEGLTRLLERLQARLGREHVQRVVAVEDHRPERAIAFAAAIGESPAPPSVTFGASAPSRPVWLLATPQVLPERRSQPLLAGQPLQLIAGPERIEAGWWDGADALAARDYFIARDIEGALLWIYRQRVPLTTASGAEGWFLQGRFG